MSRKKVDKYEGRTAFTDEELELESFTLEEQLQLLEMSEKFLQSEDFQHDIDEISKIIDAAFGDVEDDE